MINPPIAPVLAHYGWDERAAGYGQWVNTRCPFHADRNASGRVHLEDGLFQCKAGCFDDRTLTAYGIVMAMETCDIETAKAKVKELTGHDGTGSGGGALSPGNGARLASSRLPAWTRDKSKVNRLVSSRRRRRD